MMNVYYSMFTSCHVIAFILFTIIILMFHTKYSPVNLYIYRYKFAT